ncbi:hypothetical protein [Blastococcus sp. SYSU DS0617]
MMYRAAAALPFDDPAMATAGLRGQLRVMAAAAGAFPDWSTLEVEGPIRQVEHRGRDLSEWTATVRVTGACHDLSDRCIDELVPSGEQALGAADGRTAPLLVG